MIQREKFLKEKQEITYSSSSTEYCKISELLSWHSVKAVDGFVIVTIGNPNAPDKYGQSGCGFDIYQIPSVTLSKEMR